MSEPMAVDPPQEMPALLAVRWFWAFAMLALGTTLVSDLLVRAELVLPPHDDRGQIELSMAGFGITAFAIGAFGLWQRPVRWLPARPGLVLRSYLPLFVAWVGLLIGYLQGMHAIGHPVAPQMGLLYFGKGDVSSTGFWVVALATTFAAPLAEELVFRGYLHTLLRTWLGGWPTILIVGILFGLMHGLDYAIPITVLGVYFGWLRDRSGSLLASMCAHALHNGIVVVVTTCWPQTLVWMYPQ
jgi:membrane protease YdiL (CAAX protease family)